VYSDLARGEIDVKNYIDLFSRLKPYMQIILTLSVLILLLVVVTNHTAEENLVNLLLVLQYVAGNSRQIKNKPNLLNEAPGKDEGNV
jgi:hypothetical protein